MLSLIASLFFSSFSSIYSVSGDQSSKREASPRSLPRPLKPTRRPGETHSRGPTQQWQTVRKAAAASGWRAGDPARCGRSVDLARSPRLQPQPLSLLSPSLRCGRDQSIRHGLARSLAHPPQGSEDDDGYAYITNNGGGRMRRAPRERSAAADADGAGRENRDPWWCPFQGPPGELGIAGPSLSPSFLPSVLPFGVIYRRVGERGQQGGREGRKEARFLPSDWRGRVSEMEENHSSVRPVRSATDRE